MNKERPILISAILIAAELKAEGIKEKNQMIADAINHDWQEAKFSGMTMKRFSEQYLDSLGVRLPQKMDVFVNHQEHPVTPRGNYAARFH